MEDLISVLVAVYNVEDFLERCLDSIIIQTYKNIEIIIIDDGSDDNSGEICEYFLSLDNRIKLLHINNKGLSYVRNLGISLAKGKYITFVDGDDYLENDYIETLYNNLIKYNADLSCCSYYRVFNDSIIPRNKSDKTYVFNSKEAIEKSYLDKGMEVYAWNKLYKKELFNDISFPLKRKSQDRFIMYDIFNKCDKVVYETVPKYFYLQRKTSAAHNLVSINKDAIDASINAMKLFKNNLDLYKLATKDYIKTYLGFFKKEVYYTKTVNNELRNKIIDEIKKYDFIDYNLLEKIEIILLKNFVSLYKIIIMLYYGRKYSRMI